MQLIQSLLGLILGRRYREKVRRENEMNRRMSQLRINRQVESIRRRAEKAKQEALSLEQGGNHVAAVAKASVAANLEKTFQMASSRVATCENVRIQGETQKELRDLLVACNEMTKTVIKDVDVDGALAAQAALEEADLKLAETQEAMVSFQEGFSRETTVEQRNEAGEDALAKILKEYGGKNAEKAEPVVEPAALPEPANEVELNAHQEWRTQRSKMLEELAG